MDLQQRDLNLAFLFPGDYLETWAVAGMGLQGVLAEVPVVEVPQRDQEYVPLVVGERSIRNSR